MDSTTVALRDAVEQFQRQDFAEASAAAEQEREAVTKRFPRQSWPSLTLERYALGQEDSEDAFCRWMEFKTQQLGSMRGGSALKHLIYKRKNAPGWYYDESSYGSVEEAWQAVRAGFVRALECAESGDWDEIDQIEAIYAGPALRLKTLHVYFPQEVFPIYAHGPLKHFLTLLSGTGSVESGMSSLQLNRALLAAVRRQPGLMDWSNVELMRLLYRWADPRKARRILKIAPGHDAKYWDDCLKGGYICVGWDEVGDLREFESKDDFRTRFAVEYGETTKKTKLTEKANEVWQIRDVEPGDVILANRGTSEILAVGEVLEPGYEWMPERHEFRHTIRVKWDVSKGRRIPTQKRWAFVTVAKVSASQYAALVDGGPSDGPPVPLDQAFEDIAEALERKGQAILYGPPGTGKTYIAQRFAVWWLAERSGDSAASKVLTNTAAFHEADARYSTAATARRLWWVVANPKEWIWDKLFSDGTVRYRYGRIQRNYALVQPGDLVVGYSAAPDKKIVALARVQRGLFQVGDAQHIELEPVERIAAGISYEELLKDPILSASEPIRLRCQGTLFALSEREIDQLTTLLLDRNPGLEPAFNLGKGIGQLTRLTFHASYSYEDFIEGFRPAVPTGDGQLSLALEDGVFKRICREAQANHDNSYIVVIDEINRANIAKVFGELITLLEKDKRGLMITLPQSREPFAIPENVFVLGTMNTADRSIKLLDAALRRRFAFLEMMPDTELLRGAKVGSLDLSEFLDELNRRIAERDGREKQIGHSYLMDSGEPISDVSEFGRRFRQEILPLLQEYCYEDYRTLAHYIGEALVDVDAQTLDTERLNDGEQLLAALQSLLKEPKVQ